MKKGLIILLSIPFCLTFCSNQKSSSDSSIREHTYSNEWSYDENYHWHASTCGHDVTTDKEEHSFSDWHYSSNERWKKCEICDYKLIDHIPDGYYDNFSFVLNDDGASYSISCSNKLLDVDIYIPDSYNNLPVTIVEENGFRNITTNKSKVVIGDNVKLIKQFAFAFCNTVFIDTGKNTEIIELGAFSACFAREIILHDSLKTIGKNAFSNNDLSGKVVIPKNVDTIDGNPFYRTPISGYVVSEENKYFAALDGILYTKDLKTLISCPKEHSGSFSLPDGLVSIYDYAFCATSIKDFCCPDTLLEIGEAAFSETPLESMALNDNIKSIGSRAFLGTNLKEIELPNISKISLGMFQNNSSLNKIIIPKSVALIETLSFKYDQKLENIDYLGTKEEWNKIEKEDDWCDETLKTITCSDGIIEL